MAQLTYWSLQAYDHVPAVRQGRKSLVKQMEAEGTEFRPNSNVGVDIPVEALRAEC